MGALAMALSVGCGGSSEAPPKPHVTFTLPATVTTNAATAIVSLETSSGVAVFSRREIPLASLEGGGKTSQAFELDAGAYRVTELLVGDGAGTGLYGAPGAAAKESVLGQVTAPLPIQFTLVDGQDRTLAIEVVRVTGFTPAEFGYASFAYDVEKYANTARRVHHYDPGADTTFGTDDDVVGDYNFVVYKDDGDSFREHWYSGAIGRGADTLWFTEDDVPAGGFYQPGDTEGSGTNAPGVDGLWGTTDDVIANREVFDAVVDGDVRFNAFYGDPGADGNWGTADDLQTRAFRRELNANGGEVRRVAFFGPGDDGEWYTADDEVGLDWFGAWVQNTYLPANTASKWDSWDRQVRYDGPGGDGDWLTADDRVRECLTQEFEEGTQYWTKRFTFRPGEDGECFTVDDVPSGYSYAINTY